MNPLPQHILWQDFSPVPKISHSRPLVVAQKERRGAKNTKRSFKVLNTKWSSTITCEIVLESTLTAVEYFLPSFRLISSFWGAVSQQLLTEHDPDVPWHLQICFLDSHVTFRPIFELWTSILASEWLLCLIDGASKNSRTNPLIKILSHSPTVPVWHSRKTEFVNSAVDKARINEDSAEVDFSSGEVIFWHPHRLFFMISLQSRSVDFEACLIAGANLKWFLHNFCWVRSKFREEHKFSRSWSAIFSQFDAMVKIGKRKIIFIFVQILTFDQFLLYSLTFGLFLYNVVAKRGAVVLATFGPISCEVAFFEAHFFKGQKLSVTWREIRGPLMTRRLTQIWRQIRLCKQEHLIFYYKMKKPLKTSADPNHNQLHT